MNIIFILFLCSICSGSSAFFWFRYLDAKHTDECNLKGWERAATCHEEERNLRYEFARRLRESEERLKASAAKLRKYGLEDI